MSKQHKKIINHGDNGSEYKDDSKELLSSAYGPDAEPNSYMHLSLFLSPTP